MVCCDFPTSDKEDISSAKIPVDTLCFHFIDNWIWFFINGVKFKLHFREICLEAVHLWKSLIKKKEVQFKFVESPSLEKEMTGESGNGVFPQDDHLTSKCEAIKAK